MTDESTLTIIDKTLYDNLTLAAAENERLRMNFNLHATLDDAVQRLLNALEPGTVLPIHRHKHTDETYFVLRGALNLLLYNNDKKLIETVELSAQTEKYGVVVPAGAWHTVEVLEKGTIIFEVKQGPYAPLDAEDILE